MGFRENKKSFAVQIVYIACAHVNKWTTIIVADHIHNLAQISVNSIELMELEINCLYLIPLHLEIATFLFFFFCKTINRYVREIRFYVTVVAPAQFNWHFVLNALLSQTLVIVYSFLFTSNAQTYRHLKVESSNLMNECKICDFFYAFFVSVTPC